MIGSEHLVLLSSILVAVPTVRAAGRMLLARSKDRKALKREESLKGLSGQKRQTEAAAIERLRNEANDLIEFSALVPTWALWTALAGIVLNIAARAAPILKF